jgi:hypothetical protein
MTQQIWSRCTARYSSKAPDFSALPMQSGRMANCSTR